ncbi:MAG: lipoate--protein ligase family protein [Chloroflexi bacterium]|nr:lipoate--protein ligase family protein [Chloroflexota bacterium]
MTEWRLITDDGVSASFGLAADDAVTQRVGAGQSPPSLRLYTYRSHCALVGRFQNVENEIHVDYCRANHIAINRRPTGGGAIIMGSDQLGVALILPGHSDDAYSRARELMERFSEGLVRGLNNLGVQARFRRKNDIEVNGRKIVGLGIYRAPSDGLLFHASLLVDLDVPLMLRVLDTPFEKISDKEIATVAARTTTVRREVGWAIPLQQVRACIAQAYAEAFGVSLVAGDFSHEERQVIAALEQDKYLTDGWTFQTTEVPDAFGSAKVKTAAGLLDVRATLAGRMLKAVFIGGDFFTAENAIAALEAGLRWHTAEPGAVAATLEKNYARWQTELCHIPLADLVQAVHTAVQRANIADAKARADPYGCFVNPGGAA